MIFGKRLISAALVNVAVAMQGSAVEIDCVYDPNEEWPLWDERTCQTRSSRAGLLLSDQAKVSAGYHECTDPLSDKDGDGWGWENGSSCVVPTNTGRYPLCTLPDLDGDGWGWENGESCVVNSGGNPAFPECTQRNADIDGDGWGFENGGSCFVGENSAYPACSQSVIDDDGDGWGYENQQSCRIKKVKDPGDLVVFQQSFDGATPGLYTGAQLNHDWNTPIWHLGFDQGRAHIVSEKNRGNTLRVTYPANTYGAAGAVAFLSDLEFSAALPKSYEALYVSYDIKFAQGFEFVRGGKLPGLCGYNNTQSPGAGCNTGGGFPDGFDGWSARGMWRDGGIMENYVYHSAQTNFYGDDEYWSSTAIPGQWHEVQHRVVLNTPGKADGVLQAWFDGNKVLDEASFVYRKTADIGINLFYFSTFYGGNDPSWAPTQDQYVYFDNIRIATTPLASTLAVGAALADDADAAAVGSNTSAGPTKGSGTIGLSIVFMLFLRRSRSGRK